MDILAPWSLSTYIPLNGFHPLYRSVARIRAPDLRIVAPKKLTFEDFRGLMSRGFFDGKLALPLPDWAIDLDNSLPFDQFLQAHSAEEILLQSNLSGDVELHHTAPVTGGNRPFVLHCESFLPVFFPFFQQGVELDKTSVGKTRNFYRKLFESNHCLGIVSHVPETLDQISHFFHSDIIDDKLVAMPIGLDPAYIAKDVDKPRGTRNFVFLNSAHQNQQSFVLRGGISCLKLAIHLLSERSDVKFYFRTKRPADKALVEYGLDVNKLKRFETDRVVWIEQYLPDWALTKLVAKSHFVLLPSANLHSVSVMSGLANGAIPIVTDTIGTDIYVEHMINGVVIRGVRSEVWHNDEELRIRHDDHRAFKRLEKALTESLIKIVSELLGVPEKIDEMARAGQQAVRQRFNGESFAGRLVDEIRTRCAITLRTPLSEKTAGFAEGDRWVEDISEEHFAGPPQPFTRLTLDSACIVQLGKNFMAVPRGRQREFVRNQDWSLLRLAFEEFSPRLARTPRVAFASNLRQSVQSARLVRDPRVIYRIWALLRPYKVPFYAARAIYRAFRRLGLLR
jgi:glycosyltransferase involved in cell wall biosynthesis